jgi:antitoxin MazE
METRVQKWGNSLAVRIPQAFASEVGLAENSAVEMRLENGDLIISAPRRQKLKLADLLEQVTPENRHDPVDFGKPVGKEVW